MRPATLAALLLGATAAPTKRSEYAASVARCADGVGTRTFVKLLADSPLPAYASTLRDAEARLHALVGTISARLDADELDRALADPRVLRVEASCVARTDPAEAATTRRQLSSQSSLRCRAANTTSKTT